MSITRARVLALLGRPAWQDVASCSAMGDAWPGFRLGHYNVDAARAARAGCPVAAECLRFALGHAHGEQVVVWASTTSVQRDRASPGGTTVGVGSTQPE